MIWRVVLRPEVYSDIIEAEGWYEARRQGLGLEFREEVIRVFDTLAENPFLNARQHPQRNIRWRFPRRFPYRVVYEVIEADNVVIVAAVIHAARHERHWKKRL